MKYLSLILKAGLISQFVISVSIARGFVEEQLTKESVFNETPYFMQRDNYYEPGGTCGLTSAAMVINYWYKKSSNKKRSVTPDKLYTRFGKYQGQSPILLDALFKKLGFQSSHTYLGTRADIKKQLSLGRPIIIHGWFTRNGHIIVLTGFNENGFIANDPGGIWKRCYKCGYSGGYGKSVLYTYSQLNSSVLGRDGDIWYSYISKAN